MKDITDTELLVVRHLKRNETNLGILTRIVGDYYALNPCYIKKQHIFDCLMNIIDKFDLMPSPWKNVRYFFTDKPSFEPVFEDIWDAWIYRASSVIRHTEIAKFPRYPSPAYFRNQFGE